MGITDLHTAPIPFDRLTELANEMQELAQTAENADVKGIICLSTEDTGGIVMFGFEDTTEAIAQLLLHIKAVFQSDDRQFGIMTDQGFMVL
jgi:hypothetical protein